MPIIFFPCQVIFPFLYDIFILFVQNVILCLVEPCQIKVISSWADCPDPDSDSDNRQWRLQSSVSTHTAVTKPLPPRCSACPQFLTEHYLCVIKWNDCIQLLCGCSWGIRQKTVWCEISAGKQHLQCDGIKVKSWESLDLNIFLIVFLQPRKNR